MFLQVENITKYYKEKRAISNINFALEKGQLLCLLGPSGCGKSTILNAIGGFVKLDCGKIILNGIDITNEAPENRSVATVFQSYGLFSHKDVLANVVYGLKFQKIPKAKRFEMGMEMLKTVGLASSAKKRIGELSGGEQQRVALARSLIIKPKLLLLDEPLSNLDAKLRIAMRQEIKRVQKTFNITTIFVTHDQSEAFEIADTIILMNNGAIMQRGTATELYNNPCNEFVLNFIGAANKQDERYFRPERISVSLREDERHRIPAVIDSLIFKGDTIELGLYSQEKILRAFVLNDGTQYKINDRVFIDYRLEKIVRTEN